MYEQRATERMTDGVVARANGGEYTKGEPARSHPQIADRHAPGGGHLK